jgi:hypothetical protein
MGVEVAVAVGVAVLVAVAVSVGVAVAVAVAAAVAVPRQTGGQVTTQTGGQWMIDVGVGVGKRQDTQMTVGNGKFETTLPESTAGAAASGCTETPPAPDCIRLAPTMSSANIGNSNHKCRRILRFGSRSTVPPPRFVVAPMRTRTKGSD